MNARTAELLAQDLAASIFTDGFGRKAKRIVMDYDGDLGGTGWCENAVADVIADSLKSVVLSKEVEGDAR